MSLKINSKRPQGFSPKISPTSPSSIREEGKSVEQEEVPSRLPGMRLWLPAYERDNNTASDCNEKEDASNK